jgi:hypothetical protein
MGIANQGSPQDSGAIAKTASPATVSVTVPANADATQPVVDHGTVALSLTALGGTVVLGEVDLYASDGTNTEYLGTIAGSSSAVGGQGATLYQQVFSALVNITTIKTLTARLVTTTANVVTMDLRFNFGD